jgi:hypothetical protein
MEKNKNDYNKLTESSPKSKCSDPNIIFLIISIVSWVLYLALAWMSFFIPNTKGGYYKAFVFWLNIIYRTNDPIIFFTIYINYVLFYMIVAIVIGFSTVGFFVYLHCYFITKDVNVRNGMMGNVTKFHFIPLCFISLLFIIGESLGQNLNYKNIHLYTTILFNFIALISLIIIRYNTEFESAIYILTINRGAYSSLIALLVYNFFYTFWLYGNYIKQDTNSWDNGCIIAFSLLIGIINNCLSFWLKDIILAFVNILIYIGMITNFFKLKKDDITLDFSGSYAGGIIDIVMLVLSICLISFLVLKYKNLYLIK